ncbi:MAG: thioredoxin domain-containing protein [Candidatus Angelobacter sp.]
MAARALRIDPALPTLDQEKIVPGTCYRQLFLSVTDSQRQAVLYLSPDKKFLSPALWDIALDPQVTDARLSEELLENARLDGAPSRGQGSTAVSVVVFSDFQCPFCAAFTRMFDQYMKENPGKVRVIFRNAPLSIHPWAKPAAEAGICISRQNPAAFWQFHDLLFSKQKAVTSQTLGAEIDGLIRGLPGVNRDEYAKCMASSYPNERLQQDLDLARSYNIHSTPTVFINGKRHGGFRDLAEFVSAVDLASKTVATLKEAR